MMATVRSLAVCLLLVGAGPNVVSASQLRAVRKHGCGQNYMGSSSLRKAASKINLRRAKPGAGLGEITPFEESFNDGFSMVGCVKDDMLLHGDKFGDGKFSYKMGSISNVSILHYTDIVPREDQEQMTHETCFGLCRTVPQMHFFGITNGRDCYCAPYYKQIASDSSSCDAVCDGDQTTMCGGKTKSSIFEMHACNDAQANLLAASSAGETERRKLGATAELAIGVAAQMQETAARLQPQLGKVGDSAAADHMQQAKVFAGKLQAAAEVGLRIVNKLDALIAKAGAHDGDVESTEALTTNLKETAANAKASTDEIDGLKKASTPPQVAYGADLYYPVMYFVDKDYKGVPSTCGGTAFGEPILGGYEGCAAACEASAGKCVGFSYMAGGLCFLLSEVTTATYYTGCGEAQNGNFLANNVSSEQTKSAAFLAKTIEHVIQDDDYYEVEGPKQDNYGDYEPISDDYYYFEAEVPEIDDYSFDFGDSMDELDGISDEVEIETVTDDYYSVEEDEHGFSCVVKFADFQGTTLKPDPSGKCEKCLKEATKADRCPE